MRQVLKTKRQLWIRKNRNLLPETFLENNAQKIKHYTSLKPLIKRPLIKRLFIANVEAEDS